MPACGGSLLPSSCICCAVEMETDHTLYNLYLFHALVLPIPVPASCLYLPPSAFLYMPHPICLSSPALLPPSLHAPSPATSLPSLLLTTTLLPFSHMPTTVPALPTYLLYFSLSYLPTISAPPTLPPTTKAAVVVVVVLGVSLPACLLVVSR